MKRGMQLCMPLLFLCLSCLSLIMPARSLARIWAKNCYLFLWFIVLYSCAVLFGVFVIGVSCVLYLMMSFQNMISMIPIINS